MEIIQRSVLWRLNERLQYASCHRTYNLISAIRYGKHRELTNKLENM